VDNMGAIHYHESMHKTYWCMLPLCQGTCQGWIHQDYLHKNEREYCQCLHKEYKLQVDTYDRHLREIKLDVKNVKEEEEVRLQNSQQEGC